MSARLSLELAAVPTGVPAARGAVSELCAQLGIERELAERVRLAVTEACTNCVLHAYDGNGASSTFVLEARLEHDALVVIVRDSGLGMVDDRRSENGGLGLGLRLIRRLATSVDITSRLGQGTQVAMRFAP